MSGLKPDEGASRPSEPAEMEGKIPATGSGEIFSPASPRGGGMPLSAWAAAGIVVVAVVAGLLFALLFAAGRLGNKALRFLLFWLPTITCSTLAIAILGTIRTIWHLSPTTSALIFR